MYSAVMVILVAAGLALLSIALKGPRQANIRTEKMRNILTSFGKGEVPKGKDKNSYIEKQYATYIVDTYTVDVNGEKVQGENAFDIDMKYQLSLPSEKRTLPVFEAKDGNKIIYILPLYGTGLWGPIWGYLAVNSDGSTVVGSVFAHSGETPGLGAEIATTVFSDRFISKEIFEGNQFVSIAVVKPGSSAATTHNVDGISGGTLTSDGVNDMLRDNLTDYKAFLMKNGTKFKAASVPVVEESAATSVEGENAEGEEAEQEETL
jgi:Na+-transporting NADH:ubiquinone oxidoreductase subunit C